MSQPQFPDPMGRRELVNPGATAHKAGLSLEDRVKALEQGAAGRPGPGVVDGSLLVADAASTGRAKWSERTTPYYAAMYLANSGSPTHTTSGTEQKVGSGGGTATWTASHDIRPTGVSAQVDTATNKRIDIRKTGVYLVTASVGFSAISDAKAVSVAVYTNGTRIALAAGAVGALVTPVVPLVFPGSFTSGDYLELYANQNDSASETYFTGLATACMLSIQYVGPAS
jgi:hypothetical protein